MTEWHDGVLGDLCRFAGGQGFSPEHQGLASGDLPFIKVSDMETVGNERHIVRSNNWVTDETAKRAKFKVQPRGASVFAKIGEAIKRERVRVLSRPTIIDNNMMAAIAEPSCDPVFLYYLLGYTPFSKDHGGTSLPYLKQSDLSAIPVAYPNPEEQRRIAGVLEAFDDLIETNLNTVASIDDLGRVLAETLGQESGTWVPLAEACTAIESGRRPKGGVKGVHQGVPSLGAESVKGLRPFDFSKTKFVPEVFAEGMTRGVLQDMDVLIYKDGGKPGEFFPHALIVGCGYPFSAMVINEHVFRVRADNPLRQGFLYFWLSTDEMMSRMQEAGSRTAAIPGMNLANFGALPVPIPDPEVCAHMMPVLDELATGALTLLAECRDLSAHRDELLPLLMSGKVRVSEVEGVA